MGFYIFLIVVIAIIGLMMGVVVLLQSGKGGGLAGIASGGATQMLGTRQAPDFLEKATWTLATIFVVLCIATNFFIGRGSGGQESIIQQNLGDAPAEFNTAPIDVTPSDVQAPAGESVATPPEGSGDGSEGEGGEEQ